MFCEGNFQRLGRCLAYKQLFLRYCQFVPCKIFFSDLQTFFPFLCLVEMWPLNFHQSLIYPKNVFRLILNTFSRLRKIMKKVLCFRFRSLADPRWRQGRTPRVQILSFLCSFRQNTWKLVPLLGVGSPPRENPGCLKVISTSVPITSIYCISCSLLSSHY